MTDWLNTQLGTCAPFQIITFDIAYSFDDIQNIKIYNSAAELYDVAGLAYSYSVDGVCWSCFVSLKNMNKLIININSDIYIKIKLQGGINSIKLNNCNILDYKTQLDSEFNLTTTPGNQNTYDPYANMECAVALQQQLTETISTMFGLPCYYFKLSPNAKSKDITFKEYALMNVESVKQLKIIIENGQMPSVKPDFADFGFEFQTDWETEIAKGAFATAFGIHAQPMEGDLIYIPLMTSMWMVNEGYEEKNTGLMWRASTFKVALVKYQEKDMVDLGDTQKMVDELINTQYLDLFGDEENLDSDTNAVSAPKYAADNQVAVFESDATRKYMTCDPITINSIDKLYHNSTLISDNHYEFTNPDTTKSQIIYQRKYCGDECTVSFIVKPNIANYEGNIFTIGKYFAVKIKQNNNIITIYVNKDEEHITLNIEPNNPYLIILRWSKTLNLIDFSAYKYTYNQNIPIYKLNNNAYYFDLQNPVQVISRYNDEFTISAKSDIAVEGFFGWLTNIKLFDVYDNDMSEIIQTYPNHQHLLVNDTARKLVDNTGVALR